MRVSIQKTFTGIYPWQNDELMQRIKVFVKEKLKFSRQENESDNSNKESYKILWKRARISKIKTRPQK